MCHQRDQEEGGKEVSAKNLKGSLNLTLHPATGYRRGV